MAFAPPSATDVKTRFPEFAPVADALINMMLAEATPQVGEAWVERDRRPAVMYLVAHLLAAEGEPGRSITGNGSAATGPMRRRKVGDVETEFAGSGAAGGSSDGYDATTYGRQFLRLLRLNFPGVAVV